MDFDVFYNQNGLHRTIIILKTVEAPFDALDIITDVLKKNNFFGDVIIDQLLHSGNNDERFISGKFDGNKFDVSTFKFKKIPKCSPDRKYMCDFLRNSYDMIDYLPLTKEQKQLIMHGYNI